MINSSVVTIPYSRRFRRDLLRLIENERLLHIHLDWHTIDEWIGDGDVPMYLAWHDRKLIGALAASPVLDGTSWLRLVAGSRHIDIADLLAQLWPPLQSRLEELGVQEVAVLLLQPWLASYLQELGFKYREEIVTLRRERQEVPPPRRTDVRIRYADWREADRAVEVDHAAFAPIWQLDKRSIQQAARMSASFTLAEIDHRIVGYQISTLYQDGAHLARLATLPDIQGTGVGGVLLGEMIHQFSRRGIWNVTVNTQQTNTQSQRLYQRYAFEFTGLNMPVWTLRLQYRA